jgi:hypothetical protein
MRRLVLSLLGLLVAGPALAQQINPGITAGIEVSLRGCTSCDLTGATDSTAALNAFLTANAGATIVVPPNANVLIDSGNITIPNATRLLGSGAPSGMMQMNNGFVSSSTITLNPSYTIVLSNGAGIQYLNIIRKGLIASPTDAQVNSDVAAWGADSSLGFLIPATTAGAIVDHDFIMGFHWMGMTLADDYTIENVQGDDYNGIYTTGGDYARLVYVRLEPWRCLQSVNCTGGTTSPRPGVGFYVLGGPYMHNEGVENWAHAYIFDNSNGGISGVHTSGSEFFANGFAAAGSGPPYNGFGSSGFRFITPNYKAVSDLFANWFSINYQIDGGGGQNEFIDLNFSDVTGNGNPSPVAPMVMSGPGQVPSVITIGGSVSNGSSVTATITGRAAPPPFISLAQTAGGTIAATTYYVKLTYTGSASETTPGAEYSLAVAANNLLTVRAPVPWPGTTGYNVYVSTSAGSETLQNASPIAFGTNWTEPTTGLIVGTSPPGSNNTVWSENVTYTVNQIPGVTDSLLTTAEFLEAAINSDATLTGNHVWATYKSGPTIIIDAPSIYPTITVTTSVTGTLTAPVTTGVAQISPSGAVRGMIVTASKNYPLFEKLNGGSWEFSGMNTDALHLWPNWAVGFSATYDFIYNTPGNLNPTVTGTGCSYNANNNLRDTGGYITETTASTGCTVVFAVPFPYPPICSVVGYGSAQPASITLPTTTGFSWTNPAPSATESFGVRCAVDY